MVDKGLRLVLEVDALALLLVDRGIDFSVLDHLLHLVVAEGGCTGDGDGLLLAAALVLGGDAEDAVGVDIEGHLDLGHAPRRRRDAGELELAEQVVVLCGSNR